MPPSQVQKAPKTTRSKSPHRALLLALGRCIATRRKASWLTQGDIAMTIGLTAPYVGLVERGRRGVLYLTVVDIARTLGTSAARLASEAADGPGEVPRPTEFRKTPRAKKTSARAKRAHRELLAGLGRRIRSLRIGKGLTLQELSKLSGLSVAYLSSIERGVRNPTYMTVVGIASALGTRVAKLISRGVHARIRRSVTLSFLISQE